MTHGVRSDWNPAGPEAGAGGTLATRAEAVVPVIGVGKAAAGPAQDRGLDGAHHLNKCRADARLIGMLEFSRPRPHRKSRHRVLD